MADEIPISNVYHQLLDAWNRRDAAGFTAPFAEDGNVVGFDGSQMNGRAEIETTIRGIFNDHQTGRYVGIVREVRFLTPEIALLRAVSGIVPNTPAQFHGRPELAHQLTEELRTLL
jgi:uncharacterized protein (TIGR02246 family)